MKTALSPRPVSRFSLATLSLLLTFVAAPVVGDIGSCGEDPADLDPVKFFAEKARIDCAHCSECDIQSFLCGQACDPTQNATAFPRGCYPYVQDGNVCLNALDAASCDEYRDYMNDQGPTSPTECNFCPPEEAPK